MKKTTGLLIISLILLSLASTFVFAQPKDTGNVFRNFLVNNPLIAGIFGQKTPLESVLLIKVLMFILITSLLFGLATFFWKDTFSKGIRYGMTIPLALIATIGIPNKVALGMATLGGGIVSLLIYGGMLIGVMWIMFGTMKEPTRLNYGVKAVLAIFITYLLGRFAVSGAGIFPSVEDVFDIWDGVVAFSGFLSSIFVFISIYYVFMAFAAEGLGAAGMDIAKEAGLATRRSTMKSIRKYMPLVRRYDADLEKDFIAAKELVAKKNIAGVLSRLKDAESNVENLSNTQRVMENLHTSADEVAEGAGRGDLKKKIDEAYSSIMQHQKAIFDKLRPLVNEITVLADLKAPLLGPRIQNITNRLEELRTLSQQAGNAVRALEAIEGEIERATQ
jgi:hypothetical protein